MHVDLLVAYFRVELALGVEELKGKAATSTARLLATISKRDQQAAIFGSRTISEMKWDEAKVARKQQVRVQLGTWYYAVLQLCTGRSQDARTATLLHKEACQQHTGT